MHLLRCLVEAHFGFHLVLYIDAKSNHLADDLSRNNFSQRYHWPTLTQPQCTTPSGSSVVPPSQLDLSLLATSVQYYFHNGLAPSTRKAYQAAMKHFHGFCLQYNVSNPFPVSEHLLCCFTAFLADQGLAPQTAKCYLSAVRDMQIVLGLPDPREQSSLSILKRIQAGISCSRMLRGSPPRIRLPITTQVLDQIQSALTLSSDPNRVVLWAIAVTAFLDSFDWVSYYRTQLAQQLTLPGATWQ